jgi:hypothetical protein
LGFQIFLQAAYSNAGPILTVSGRRSRSNSLSGLANFRLLKFSDFFDRQFPSPMAAQISSPWSQKAAALVADLEAVDIR